MKMSTSLRATFIAFCIMFLLVSGSVRAESKGAVSGPTTADTSFTYQGRLAKDGEAIDSNCDFRFTLFDATDGHTIGPIASLTNVPVTEGLFTVELDFGVSAFDGSGRLLAIEVRCPAGSGDYSTLPRQKLTAAPYALYAQQAPWSGLSDVPPGLDDGDDNTTYTAGTGLTLTGAEFSLIPTYRLPQTCTNGQIAEWNGSAWACGDAGGDITAVYAGAGLTGGAISGDATLSVDFAGSGAASNVAHSDHNHDSAYVNENQANSVNSAMIEDGAIIIDDIQDGTILAEIMDDDGPGSGLNADLLDGQHAGSFAGVSHNHLGETWTGSDNSLVIEGSFSDAPLVLGNDTGLGLYVHRAGDTGVYVDSAGDDGFYVHEAGNPSKSTASSWPNGFEVAGAQGHGLYVGRANENGVYVNSAGNNGVVVTSADGNGVSISSVDHDGVYVGLAGNPSTWANSDQPNGFEVAGTEGFGLYVGHADQAGVVVDSAGSDGVYVGSAGADGVFVASAGQHGRANTSSSSNGFEVAGAEGAGLYVGRADQRGVEVISAGWDGVFVNSVGNVSTTTGSVAKNGFEVAGAEGFGLYVGYAGMNGVEVNSAGIDGIYVLRAVRRAATFNGDVLITGDLINGAGSSTIDHPLDPEHKYLSHSVVESPEMKNIYDGVVTLGADGQAWVGLPAWFEALNKDFRYQLTAIGGPGPGLYIAEEIQGNRFQIAGGEAGLKVSWQVTGIRHDPYAEANPIPVEEDKPLGEQGTYLHPEAYGQPETKGMIYQDAANLALEAGAEEVSDVGES